MYFARRSEGQVKCRGNFAKYMRERSGFHPPYRGAPLPEDIMQLKPIFDLQLSF